MFNANLNSSFMDVMTTSTQVHKYTSTQVHKFTSTQVHKYTSSQVPL